MISCSWFIKYAWTQRIPYVWKDAQSNTKYNDMNSIRKRIKQIFTEPMSVTMHDIILFI